MRARLAVPLLAAVLAAACAPAAWSATAAQCTVGEARACVLLVEVDGLEPQDVTPTTTPFLWSLSHPDQAAPTDPTSLPGAALTGRSGYVWAAARGVMQASTAPATAALLTGSDPLAAGIPGDEFSLDGATQWFEGAIDAVPEFKGGSTLLELVGDDPQRSTAAFVGSPYVARMIEPEFNQGNPPVARWSPTSQTGSDPALCAIPRELEPPSPEYRPPDCAARDAVTLAQAYQALSALPGSGPQLTYVHLAQLGAVKRLAGDVDVATPAAEDTAESQAVAKALTELDQALAGFVAAYANSTQTSALWQSTVLMLVGNHGYELTPPANRVPSGDPGQAGPTYDLADHVAHRTGRAAELVPQGTIATVYWKSGTPTPQAVADLAKTIEEVGEACTCIHEVLATRELEDAPSAWVGEKHPSWGLHARPERPSGELIVVAAPGYAFGKVVTDQTSAPGDQLNTNPYMGSAGGPRNRAIAALVHGPRTIVRQVQSQYAGVPANPSAAPDTSCVDRTPNPAGVVEALPSLNAAPGDDVLLPGYACQAETIDFAPSIAALLHLELPSHQIDDERVRLLNEAFTQPLVPVLEEQELPPPVEEWQPPLPPPPPPEYYEPDPPEPPPPPAPVELPPPPPPPVTDPFDFDGIVRALRARVIDAAGDSWAEAPPGAQMTTIEIAGDFGRPQAAVTLTFYSDKAAKTAKKSRKAKASGRKRARPAASKRTKLRALAKFKPFTIKRGPAKLKLKIPPKFSPTHVGVTVRELVAGQPAGPVAGTVLAVADAKHLHRVKREFIAPRGGR